MTTRETRQRGPSATRRNVLASLAVGAGLSAVLTTAQAQDKGASGKKGPILFKRTAETERYYKTLK